MVQASRYFAPRYFAPRYFGTQRPAATGGGVVLSFRLPGRTFIVQAAGGARLGGAASIRVARAAWASGGLGLGGQSLARFASSPWAAALAEDALFVLLL
jgi:hypothetical protein